MTISPSSASSFDIPSSLILINDTGAVTLEECEIEKFALSQASDYEAPIVCAYLGKGQRLTMNTSNTFRECDTKNEKGKSGAIYLKSQYSTDSIEIQAATFTDCKTGSATLKSIYIDCIDGTDIIKRGNWGVYPSWTSESEDSKEQFFVTESTTSRNAQASPVLHFLFPPSSNANLESVIASPSGADEIASCGWSDLPCLSINTALTHRCITEGSQTNKVSLTSGAHSAETVQISITSQMSIVGIDSPSKLVNALSDRKPAFSLSGSANVSFSDITFLLNSTTGFIPDSSIFSVESGAITMSGIATKPAENSETPLELSAPVISISEGVTAEIGVTVEYVKISGNGAAISATMNEDSSFTLTEGSSFTHCTASGHQRESISLHSFTRLYWMHCYTWMWDVCEE